MSAQQQALLVPGPRLWLSRALDRLFSPCPAPSLLLGPGAGGGGLLPGGKWAAGQEAGVTATSPLGQQRGSGPRPFFCVAVGWPGGTAGRHLGCLSVVVASESGQDSFSFEGAQPPPPFALPRGARSGLPGGLAMPRWPSVVTPLEAPSPKAKVGGVIVTH